jgi:hypothetical protein
MFQEDCRPHICYRYSRPVKEEEYKRSDRKVALSKKFDDTYPYGTNISGDSGNIDGCVAIPPLL